MVYYLKIADIGVKVNCPDNLYLFDEWKIFFEEKWGRVFLVEKVRPSIIVTLTGIKVKGSKTIAKTIPKNSVNLPKVINNKIYFDNLLNQAYLLVLMRNLFGDLICKKRGVMMHASGVVVNKRAVLIMGDSGSGKTTTLKKLINKYKAIAEDEVVIIEKDKKMWAYPVLFSSKLESSQMVSNCVEVGAIITIKKGEEMNMLKMSEIEAFNFLLNQSKTLANDVRKSKLIVKQAKLLKDRVYWLGCRKEDKLDGIMEKLKL